MEEEPTYYPGDEIRAEFDVDNLAQDMTPERFTAVFRREGEHDAKIELTGGLMDRDGDDDAVPQVQVRARVAPYYKPGLYRIDLLEADYGQGRVRRVDITPRLAFRIAGEVTPRTEKATSWRWIKD